MNFSTLFKLCSLDDFHRYKMSIRLHNGKKPVAQLSPAYGRRGNRAQKNSDSLCVVFNSDRNLKSDRNRKPISGAKMRFTKNHNLMITSVFERK